MVIWAVVLFCSIGLLVAVWGGRRALLDVVTWPAFRTARWIAARMPTTTVGWRAEARLLRARWRVWRRGW